MGSQTADSTLLRRNRCCIQPLCTLPALSPLLPLYLPGSCPAPPFNTLSQPPSPPPAPSPHAPSQLLLLPPAPPHALQARLHKHLTLLASQPLALPGQRGVQLAPWLHRVLGVHLQMHHVLCVHLKKGHHVLY